MPDFTPNLGEYKTLTPFRYWCQKVLPLVYDDSLSYYELLCKVVDYLNKTMEDVETLHGDVTNLHEAYIELQNYVNNYFDNLDVSKEINNKLDLLVENGTLSKLIMPYIKSSPVIVNDINEMTNHDYIYLLSTNGHLYYWNGLAFVDSSINYTYPTNAYVQHPYQLLTSANKLSDLSECGSYAIGIASNTNMPSDMPTGWLGGNFILTVDGYVGSDRSSFKQTLFNQYFGTCTRLVRDGKGDWGNVYVQHTYQLLTSANKLSDFSECGSYAIGITSNTDLPPDMPTGWLGGNFILTVDGYVGSDRSSFKQTLFNQYFGTCTRLVRDGKGDWNTEFYVRKKVALCGDSFIGEGVAKKMSEYLNEYGYFSTSLAKGGIKASEWWDTFKSSVTDYYDIFLIALGLNGESSPEIYKQSIENIINNITNINPTARIILWCMDAWFPENYYNICKDLSEKYGIECYSMLADKNIPIRINGKYRSKFPNLDSSYANKKTAAYTVSETDKHPNEKGRILLAEYWSTIL